MRLSDGSLPAVDFLKSLPLPAQATFKALFARQLDHDVLLAKERFRMLATDTKDPRVYEWKVHSPRAWRLYGIRDGSIWYATHGSAKAGETRGVPREVGRARKIFGEGSDDELV
ncbi:hypothetical protein [Streptosporangium sp. NPDC004631]